MVTSRIDICVFISLSSHIRCPLKDTRLWIHPSLQTVPDIVKMMNETSCNENKYNVMAAKRNTGGTRYINCTCNKDFYRSRAIKNNTYSTPEDCTFRLLLHFSKEDKQWYIRQNAGHCLTHSGHLPIDGKRKQCRKRLIKDDVLKDANDLLTKNVPKSVVQEYVEMKSGKQLSMDSLAKIKQSMVIDRFRKNENESIAETLINMMDEDENVEWVAYYGSLADANDTVRVRKRSSKKRRKKKKSKVSKQVSSKDTEKSNNGTETKTSKRVENLDLTEDDERK